MTDWKKLHGDHLRGVRCLVTGGAGFIGSHIVEALANLGADIVVVDNLVGGDRKNIASFKHDFVEGSILDKDVLLRAVRDAVTSSIWPPWARCPTPTLRRGRSWTRT